MGLQGQVCAKFNGAIVALPLRLAPVIPILYPVIPAKAGIQSSATKLAIRNQV